ncbi:uncharacterized [Tachysurus ichikawai]
MGWMFGSGLRVQSERSTVNTDVYELVVQQQPPSAFLHVTIRLVELRNGLNHSAEKQLELDAGQHVTPAVPHRIPLEDGLIVNTCYLRIGGSLATT